jgi:hypothetical protein
MKPIYNVFGLSAVRVSPDDVLPRRGLLQRELIDFIVNLYSFTMRPDIPHGMPPQLIPVLTFQQGLFRDRTGDGIPIQQLLAFQNGDAVVASDTNAADTILDDYLEKLETGLGFRLKGTSMEKLYVNNMVVEFDKNIDDIIPGLSEVSHILTGETARAGRPFLTKRLMFGFGDPIAVGGLGSLEAIERADFTIEPRAGEPRGRHRYFSSAPVTTDTHARILEMIEALAPDV